jgi:soluble P-type ATPase
MQYTAVMLEVVVPGWRELRFAHLVLDVNGTLTRDGQLLPGVGYRVQRLRSVLDVRLLSADTWGRLDDVAARLGVEGQRLGRAEPEAEQKARVVRGLGASHVVAIGNGANDAAMLAEVGLAIAVLGPEGLAGVALQPADVLVASIADALDLLLVPTRLVATLRR